MEIEGKIIVVLPAREGVSARGTQWKSQDYVLETHEQYPRKCCFSVFGSDKISLFNIQSGEELRVSFDIDAHEYNGRWFNNIRAWRVQRGNVAEEQAGAPVAAPTTDPASVAPTSPAAPAAPVEATTDDLPF